MSRIRRVDPARLRVMPPEYGPYRMTIPAREALEAAGNVISRTDAPPSLAPSYAVTVAGRMPRGIVECVIDGPAQHRGLRLDSEPEYPREMSGAVAWHDRGQWVPCPAPRCGRALVWYEAGYVPGYRVCTAGHHAQLSDDGSSATPITDG